MKAFFLLTAIGTSLLVDADMAWCSEEDDQRKGRKTHHLDLSPPPLHPDGELLASPTRAPSHSTPVAKSDSVVPPADTPDPDDGFDDTMAGQAVEPHVEEDSAGALDDMGDVGGDFEE